MVFGQIIAAFFFVASSGLLFNERFRQNQMLVVIAGLITLTSIYFLTWQIVDEMLRFGLQPSEHTNQAIPPNPRGDQNSGSTAPVVKNIAALLFVASSGFLFNERLRQNRLLILIVGLVAVVATYFLTRQIADDLVAARLPQLTTTPPVERPSEIDHNGPSVEAMAKTVIGDAFGKTKAILGWIMRTGTDDQNAAVSNETVLSVLVGPLLTVLWPLIGLLSRSIRRVLSQ